MKKLLFSIIATCILIYFFYEKDNPYSCEDLKSFGVKVSQENENCIVHEKLTIKSPPITHFPYNLIINGNLKIEGTGIKSLPVGLIVKGDLDLHKTDITELPENLLVEGNFFSTISFSSDGVMCDEIPRSVRIRGMNTGCGL